MIEPHPRRSTEAPPYVVVCFEAEAGAPAGHDHVVALETADPDGGTTRWRAFDVIAAIREGERFVVEGSLGESVVEPAVCPACALVTVTVGALGERPAAC